MLVTDCKCRLPPSLLSVPRGLGQLGNLQRGGSIDADSASFSRHRRRPGLLLFAAAASGIGLVFYAKNSSMRRNEKAQKNANGGYYVSVDRSGGGV